MKRTNRLLMFLALLLAIVMTAASAMAGGDFVARKKKNRSTATPSPAVVETLAPTATPTPAQEGRPTPSPVPDGPIIDPQSIADYIFAHGCLPDNFVTKRQAQDAGWNSSYNYVSDVLPGKSIGGDRYGNYSGTLPDAPGRRWQECDCWYVKGRRTAYRIVFSNDGLVYYTEDHYNTFTQMFPST